MVYTTQKLIKMNVNPESLICPTDEHDCLRQNCLEDPTHPDCEEAVDELAQLLSSSASLEANILNSEEDPLNPDLSDEVRTSFEKVADELGVDRTRMLERAIDNIYGPGEVYGPDFQDS